MSAPDTDIDKQEKRHRAPLWGMWGGLGLVAILFLGWLLWTVSQGSEPETPVERMDDFTGQVEEVDPNAPTTRDAETTNTVPAGSD
ncbi:hypothetical protein [Salipiger aestuarii]|uniref:hypothetical protein n=1 Tax=Salipiger aestuarii TaxID=568098 RepID=UPI00123C3266|nr:hypothetical protein [Salipiger aestuarii]